MEQGIRQNYCSTADISLFKVIVAAIFITSISFIFWGCDQEEEHTGNNNDVTLDYIESVMFQQPHLLDSLLRKIDTLTISTHEQARVSTVKGLIYNNEGEYKQSIEELQKAETYFIEKGDEYHIHLNRLIRAFSFEHLKLYKNASELYGQCETYFEEQDLDRLKFRVSLGFLRMAKQLNLDKEALIERLKRESQDFDTPYFKAILYTSLAAIERNDSLKCVYYEQARDIYFDMQRWLSVYTVEQNMLFARIRIAKPEEMEHIYNDFMPKDYPYSLTPRQKVRYRYGKAYYLARQNRYKEAIEVAEEVLKEASLLKTKHAEYYCINLLGLLYKNIGDFEKESSALERIILIRNNETKKIREAQILAFGAHYRYSEQEREKLKLEVRNLGLLISIFVIVCIVIALSFIINNRLKAYRRKQNQLEYNNSIVRKRFDDLLTTLRSEKAKHTRLINQVEKAKVQFDESIVFEKLFQGIDKGRITCWEEFEISFTAIRPGWKERLRQQHASLSTKEINYCMCFYLNLENSIVAQFCDVSIDGVKTAKRRIKDKLGKRRYRDLVQHLKTFD